MTSILQVAQADAASLIAAFFQQSAGDWHSERRYYTLSDGSIQEAVSLLTIRFLEPGCSELLQLAEQHHLPDSSAFTCGSFVTWDSKDTSSNRRVSRGKTVFGVMGDRLYRDRGFATPKPVIASFRLPEPQILQLKTEYDGGVFEEELKLIGQNYRTRQTIISRGGEQQMITQYLETRLK